MSTRVDGKPRIAASSYLNTAPLIWSFLRGKRQRTIDLVTDTAPARCADMLARGEVEAALVPVIEFQRIPEIEVVPQVCVGSRGRVRSVVLATRKAHLKEIRTLALDLSSRTSAALLRVIFKEFVNVEPEWYPSQPDLDRMLGKSDAALLIGDPAMLFPRDGLQVFDLATLWREYTGLGFVFAMWMVQEGASRLVKEQVDFAAARDEGLAHLEDVISEYEGALGLPHDELRSYLLENISFDLNEEMTGGLDLFFRLAYKHGVIPEKRALKWLA